MTISNNPEMPTVSIVMPCRNEAQFIGICLDSIVANDYPKEKLELLIMDGMSNDGTRKIIQEYAETHSFIHLHDNPRRIAAAAQNIGIGLATGDVIIIMDAHDTYGPDYISKCVTTMYAYNVDHVGGSLTILPRGPGIIAGAIVYAMGHPFGVGNGSYRTGNTSEPIFTDAAAFGCYKKEVFEKFGLFDERLASSYDFEFHSRLRLDGPGILLIPDAVVYHYARTSPLEAIKHYFVAGSWITYPLRFGMKLFSLRHLVPMAFVLGLLGSAGLAFVWQGGLWILSATVITYVLANFGATAHAFSKEKKFLYLLLLPAIFACMHLSYGFGSLWGLLKVTAHPVSRLFKGSRAGAPV